MRLRIRQTIALRAAAVLAGAATFLAGAIAVSAQTGAGASTPCVGARAPQVWRHVVVLMMENKSHHQVIGARDASGTLVSPFISELAGKCGTAYSGTSGAAPTSNWHDANYRVDGSFDGDYWSKPNYATLT